MEKKLFINEFVDTIGGEITKEFTIKDKSTVKVELSPGCWGPMITPSIKSGHEVSKPIYVEGAEPGDSILIKVNKINIKSKYSSSGVSKGVEGHFKDDPTTKAYCPHCDKLNPETKVVGIGPDGIVCATCGEKIIPQVIKNGYTMKFDKHKEYGYTVSDATQIAEDALNGDNCLPKNSRQTSSLILNANDVKDVYSRVSPFIGNIGCSPKQAIPSSRNCGDSFNSLKNIGYDSLEKDDLTDAHMDVKNVKEGSVVISPVKIKGAGVYFGDVHAMQGNGELAGHTTDISAEIVVEIHLIKNFKINGPIIIPNTSDLNPELKFYSDEEFKYISEAFSDVSENKIQKLIPMQYIGSGPTLEEGINNAIDRISKFTGFSSDEVKNRCTISGSVDIGRTSGLVYLTMMTPYHFIDKIIELL
jgi:acetamidase/formamidase